MILFRVFPFDVTARPSEFGGPLFAPPNGVGRIANPDLYRELYLSSTAAGALSEAFGRDDTWTPNTFTRENRPYALARYELPDETPVCDLDNAGRLLAYDLSPSDVVARDRDVTQRWAARIYGSKKWVGIGWWSRYDSRWRSIGLWARRDLRIKGRPEILTTAHVAVQEAATLLPRRLECA